MKSLHTIIGAMLLCSITGYSQLDQRNTIFKTTALGFTQSAQVVGKGNMQFNLGATVDYERAKITDPWVTADEIRIHSGYWRPTLDFSYGVLDKLAVVGEVGVHTYYSKTDDIKMYVHNWTIFGLGLQYQLAKQNGFIPNAVLSGKVLAISDGDFATRFDVAIQYDLGNHWDVRAVGTFSTITYNDPALDFGVNVLYQINTKWNVYTGVKYHHFLDDQHGDYFNNLNYQVGAGYNVGQRWLVSAYMGSSNYVNPDLHLFNDLRLEGGVKASFLWGK